MDSSGLEYDDYLYRLEIGMLHAYTVSLSLTQSAGRLWVEVERFISE